jgi:hypothetical protein
MAILPILDSQNFKLPGYDLLDKIVDAFASRESIRVISSSEDFLEVKLLWGAFTVTKGERQEIHIEGGPRFCQHALQAISKNRKGIEVISRHIQKPALHRRLLLPFSKKSSPERLE